MAVGISHLLNDLIQSLIPAIYPILKASYHLDFGQIGLITLTYQSCASLFQPLVGWCTDKRPQPFSLAVGMTFTFAGLLSIAMAHDFRMILVSAAVIGVGSSVFHPEASRIARSASGGQHGLAQSIFQVGGNSGGALGPVLAALVVVPRGQQSVAWFSLVALLAIVLLTAIGRWYRRTGAAHARVMTTRAMQNRQSLSPRRVAFAIAILLALIFSKFFYLSSIGSYYTFFLMNKFHVSVRNAQLHLFVFLASAALGTLVGGPLGDRIGRKYIIWGSILGVCPFTLMLPHAGLFMTTILSVIIGLVLSSAFSAILVYAQELLPGRVGMVSGLFFGFAFGMAGVGAALLGRLADHTSISFVYRVCSFLPLIGLLAAFLPHLEPGKTALRPEAISGGQVAAET
jgi:FSR family fosmidomycin resistance protein-like MFS transporter